MKACTKCKIKKPLNQFRVRHSARDNRDSVCMQCERDRAKRQYQKKKEDQKYMF